jgi:uncharacterized protein
VLEEDISAKELELDAEVVSLRGPVRAAARVFRITNAVHVELQLSGTMGLTCTRCLSEFEKGLERDITLDYVVESGQRELNLDPDIREEIIFGLQIKNLCKDDCKGLCIVCGTNLNETTCKCTPGSISRKE